MPFKNKEITNRLRKRSLFHCELCDIIDINGECAHIISIADNGPRSYTMFDEYKHKSNKELLQLLDNENNGLYLCRNCHGKIDNKNNSEFTVEFLHEIQKYSINKDRSSPTYDVDKVKNELIEKELFILIGNYHYNDNYHNMDELAKKISNKWILLFSENHPSIRFIHKFINDLSHCCHLWTYPLIKIIVNDFCLYMIRIPNVMYDVNIQNIIFELIEIIYKSMEKLYRIGKNTSVCYSWYKLYIWLLIFSNLKNWNRIFFLRAHFTNKYNIIGDGFIKINNHMDYIIGIADKPHW